MPTAFKENLVVEQGATFSESWLWREGNKKTPVNLTGCTARMQVRAAPGSEVLLELTTAVDGGITLNGATGKIDLYLSDTDTDALSFTEGLYDLEIVQTPLGRVRRLMEGSFTVVPQITAAP